MKSWRETLVAPTTRILEAIENLNRTAAQICLVADAEGRLQGTVTDGDIRRGILRSVPLQAAVAEIMNRDPIVARPGETAAHILAVMNKTFIRQIPVVDDGRHIVELRTWEDLAVAGRQRDNWVVLMAGGQGNRLRPLTSDRPKPLLNIGHKPLLETILESLLQFGFRRFYIAVNYKADMIKSHFRDGRAWNCDIRYLEEEAYLGTAGALRLLGEPPADPIVVMNGDVLTKVNFETLLDFHHEQRSAATMCVREYDFKIPYGVVEIDGHKILGVVEKPVRTLFVNAGIYVLDPSVLGYLPAAERMDMTDLFARVIGDGGVTTAFPIWEYWIDIGQIDDFERANHDYKQLFD
ncbi:MAG: CBS domain-containing protein [Alphaproteobacteria bacterium]|nr:CBS domain-containing protein [Alphaproteobacteria bacterium]